MKLVSAVALFSLLLLPGIVMAQRTTVNGTIVDERGEPLVGANVLIPELLLGTSTDLNGQYNYSIPSRFSDGRTVTLRVSATGYIEVSKAILLKGATQSSDFLLEPDVLMLGNSVETGVSHVTARKELSYTVSQLGPEALQQAPGASLIASLQGKIPGVAVIKNSGAPGDGYSVRIRGSTSITGNVQPLYIVDGIILGADPVDLDALDIEQIEVVKGAAAAAQYGSRAQAGVIHIKTRRGNHLPLNQMRITVRNEFGFNQIEKVPLVNQSHNLFVGGGGAFLDINGNVVDYGQGTVIDRELNGVSFYDNAFPEGTADAFDQFFNAGSTYSNFVSMGRNGAKTNFYGSVTNLSEAGILTGVNGYSRQTARLNVDHRILRVLSIAGTGAYAQSSNDSPALSTAVSSGTMRFNPFVGISATNPLSDLEIRDASGVLLIRADPLATVENPLYITRYTDLSNERTRVMGRIKARYTPTKWLGFDAGLGYDKSDRNERVFYDQGFQSIEPNVVSEGLIERQNGRSEALNYDASAVVKKTFGGLLVHASLQYQREDFKEHTALFTGQSIQTPGIADPANVTGDVISHATTYNVLSDAYSGALDFDYKSKVFANGLFLREGNSLFGVDERWQSYYRVSGAYRVSQEAWWPLKRGVPEFKLRASYGTAGGRPRFDAQYATFDTVEGATVKRTLGNQSLKPEHSTEWELGVDVAISDRLFLELVHADRTTKDQLLLTPLPGFFGFEAQWQNAGTLESNTLEAGLYAALVRTRHAGLEIGITFDRTRQKISALNTRPFSGGPLNAFYFQSGEALGALHGNAFVNAFSQLPSGVDDSFFDLNDDGYVVAVGQGNTFRDGFQKQLWGTTVEVNGAIYPWGLPVKQVVGQGDGKSTIGNLLPDFTLGMPVNYRYRGLNVKMLWNAQIGGDVYNFTNQANYRTGRAADQDQAGKPDALKKSAQYYEVLFDANNLNAHFVEDGAFIKLRELALSYSFDSDQLAGVFGKALHQLTVSVIGRNLITLSDYSGYDPELGTTFNSAGNVGTDATLYRVDNFGYPHYRTISGKLEIQF